MTFYHPNLSICLVFASNNVSKTNSQVKLLSQFVSTITTITQYALNSITSFSVFLQFLLSHTKNTLTCFSLHFESKELTAFFGIKITTLLCILGLDFQTLLK